MPRKRDTNEPQAPPDDALLSQIQRELVEARARIAELEAAQPCRRSTESSERGPRQLLWEQWLVDTIKSLFEFSTEGAIDHTLAELGQQLNLDGCCFHVMNTDRAPVSMHSHWHCASAGAANPCRPPWELLKPERASAWLKSIEHQQCFALERGDLPADIEQVFKRSGINTSAVLPIQRRTSATAYLCLFRNRNNPRGQWTERELQLALAIGEVIDMVLERQAMTRRLADRDTRFQYAMEASRDGLWDWDLTTNHIYFSHSFLRMLGYEDAPPPMNYDSLRELFIHPDDIDYVINHYQSAIAERRDHLDFEYRMRHKNGDTLWVYSRCKFVERGGDGIAKRVVGINADITHFKDVQEELLNAKAQADSANRIKSEFLNRMSHEIRTPMNAIIGMGHLLRDTPMNQRQLDYLQNIEQSASALLQIIDKVLDFSKLDADKIVLDSIHFDLDEVLENLAQLLDADAELKNIEMVYETDSDVPRFLRGDAVRLNQVLYQLLSNAIKFSDGGEVVLRTRLERQCRDYIELTFAICDQGIGMTQEEVDNLFAPFNQADGSTSRRFGGTGLGLTICRHLIKLMGGKIHIDTAPERGTTITFNARFEHSHIGASPLHTQPRQFEGLKTLIVDDNDIARAVISKTCEHLHLRLESAACAEEAIGKLEQAERERDPFRLVLMDWRMPEIDGLTASEMIKHDENLHDKPAVVILSAYRREEVLDDAQVDSIDGFINKPLSQSRLFDAMAELFSESSVEDVPAELDDARIAEILAGRHLLLAEDNLVNQKVAAGILKKRKVQVTIANNGREAIEQMQSHSDQFDAILMDIEMPEVDGFQATRAIRNGCHKPDIPIIALTAQALKGDRERCLNAGMDGYISKPVAPDTLYQTLAELLLQESQPK